MPGELRNNQQNRRYWKVVVGRVREYLERTRGYAVSLYQVHEGLKTGYIGLEENPVTEHLTPISTTTLTRKEFANYTDRIQADFAALGVDFEEVAE